MPHGPQMPQSISIPMITARRFARKLAGLDTPFPDVISAIGHHGYIQIDPINVCGRMHDLILRNRVHDYRVGGLMRHLHGDNGVLPSGFRTAFEHHHPGSHNLVAFPLNAWPHLVATMRQRARSDSSWSGSLSRDERELAKYIFAEMATRGPLSSSDIDGNRQGGTKGWGSATLAKSTLQKLFFHGGVLIARRDGNRRVYDLPERVLPAATLSANEPNEVETARWLALTKLRQHRLATLKRNELRYIADDVRSITLTDADAPTLYCLREDAGVLETCSDPETRSAPPLLLAPLDPLIYNRRITSALWNFDYIWEVYTPPQKRTRGYYALPVLSGDEIVGHIDPKADTKSRKLVIQSRSVRRGHPTASAVKSLANFLGLR